MKLAAYLKTKELTQEAFAKSVGVTPEAVRLWCRGERTPRWRAIKAIQEATDSKVTWKDFEPAGVAAQ